MENGRTTRRRWLGLSGRIVLGAAIPAVVLIVWQAASTGSVVVPSITEVIDVLIHPFRRPPDLDSASLGLGAIVSVLRVAIGFALATVTGVPIGLLIGRSRPFRELLSPTVSAMMVVSPVAWMPVAILLFGFTSLGNLLYGEQAWRADLLDQLTLAVLAIIWVGAFFPIALNAAAGSAGVRNAHVETLQVLGASRMHVLVKVVLPASAPSVLTGMQVGAGIAWRVMVAAEFFPGTRSGLGHIIITAREQSEYRYAFAAIVVIAAIGLCVDALLRAAARRVGHWQVQER